MPGPIIPAPTRMQGPSGAATPAQLPAAQSNYIPPGPQTDLPVNPQGLQPAQDQSPEAVAARTSKWAEFMNGLTQPGMANSLLQFGVAMGQRRKPGESGQAHLLNAIKETAQGWSLGQAAKRAEQVQNVGLGQKQQEINISGRQATTAENTQAEIARHNKEQEKIAKQQADQLGGYYEKMGRAMEAKNSGSSDTWHYADIAQKQFNTLMKSLQDRRAAILDPSDPRAAELDKQMQDMYNQHNQYMQEIMRSMSGGPGATSGGGAPPPYWATPEGLTAMVQKDPTLLEQAKAAAAYYHIPWSPPGAAPGVPPDQLKMTVPPQGAAPAGNNLSATVPGWSPSPNIPRGTVAPGAAAPGSQSPPFAGTPLGLLLGIR